MDFPRSSSVVKVQALDTTLQLFVRSVNFFDPVIPGHEAYNCPAMAFLITNEATGKQIRFDAGVRKDYWNYSPLVRGRFEKGVNVKGLRIDKGVDEVLMEANMDLGDLESVVWSHWHFDHIGDMSKFPSSVKIVVGPGFSENLLPGYPANPESSLLESDYSGHVLDEIKFSDFKIGQFVAFDYFGDGSFYLLNVPGHAIGHICGFAGTTENSFILIGADCCHFAGALRPSTSIPLPEHLDPIVAGLDPQFPLPCPCTIFTDCHPSAEEERRTTPYYRPSKAPGSAYADPDVAAQNIIGVKEFDASNDELICLAHGPSLFEVLPLLNNDTNSSLNDWQRKGHKDMTRWKFLNELPRNSKPGRNQSYLDFGEMGNKYLQRMRWRGNPST